MNGWRVVGQLLTAAAIVLPSTLHAQLTPSVAEVPARPGWICRGKAQHAWFSWKQDEKGQIEEASLNWGTMLGGLELLSTYASNVALPDGDAVPELFVSWTNPKDSHGNISDWRVELTSADAQPRDEPAAASAWIAYKPFTGGDFSVSWTTLAAFASRTQNPVIVVRNREGQIIEQQSLPADLPTRGQAEWRQAQREMANASVHPGQDSRCAHADDIVLRYYPELRGHR